MKADAATNFAGTRQTTAAHIGDPAADETNDDWNQYFEHCFCDIEERDVIAGHGIKRQHPTTMLLTAAIVDSILLR